MSQRLGISTTTFQELDFVLSQNGSNINSFSTGMKTLLKNMDGVSEGNETAIANFNRLGVSVMDSNGKMRNQEEVMKDTIIAFQHMENGSEKARLAQELFGRQGQEIMPLLNQEAGNFEELSQKAHDYGLIMSDEAIGVSTDFIDTQNLMNRTWQALKNTIGVAFMPVFTGAMQLIADAINFVRPLFDAFGQVISYVFGIFKSIGEAVIKSFTETVKSSGGDWDATFQMLSSVITTVVNVIKWAFDNVLKPVLTGVGTVFGTLLGIVTSVMGSISGTITKVVNTIKSIFNFNSLVSSVSSTFNSIKNTISNILEGARNIVKKAIDKIKGIFDFSWSLPSLKLPHISITGGFSLMPLKTPKFSLKWYKEAMDEPMLLNHAQLFGMDMMNGQLLGGGEVGNEYISGDEGIRNIVREELNNLRLQVIMDSGELVGAISNKMDNALYKNKLMGARGV